MMASTWVRGKTDSSLNRSRTYWGFLYLRKNPDAPVITRSVLMPISISPSIMYGISKLLVAKAAVPIVLSSLAISLELNWSRRARVLSSTNSAVMSLLWSIFWRSLDNSARLSFCSANSLSYSSMCLPASCNFSASLFFSLLLSERSCSNPAIWPDNTDILSSVSLMALLVELIVCASIACFSLSPVTSPSRRAISFYVIK